MKLTIAVITACYNSADFIMSCIESVQQSNTFDEFFIEHIIIDDGSQDHSWEMISGIPYPNVKKFKLESNAGPAAARNFAVSKTSADFVFFLDADDVLFQNSLYYLYSFITQNNLDWVYGDLFQGDKDLRYILGKDYYGHTFLSVEEILTSLYSGEHFFQHTFLIKRELFTLVNGYDEGLRMAEDFDLSTRLLLKNILPYHVKTAVCMRRIHGKNLSTRHLSDQNMHRRDVESLFLKKYKNDFVRLLSKDQMIKIENWFSRTKQ